MTNDRRVSSCQLRSSRLSVFLAIMLRTQISQEHLHSDKKKQYEQPDGFFAGLIWRLWIKTKVTFALSMMEPWEIIIICEQSFSQRQPHELKLGCKLSLRALRHYSSPSVSSGTSHMLSFLPHVGHTTTSLARMRWRIP